MAVLIPGKLLFLAQQHTGSMAVSAALRQRKGLFVTPGHSTLKQIEDGRSWIEYPGDPGRGPNPWSLMTGSETTFTIVRNPYDVITTWFVRSKYDGTFETFVAGVGRHWASPYVKDYEIRWHADAQVRLRHETLDDDFAALLRSVRIDPVALLRENATPGKRPWPEYYSEQSLETVNDRFHVEIAAMGYPRHPTLDKLAES